MVTRSATLLLIALIAASGCTHASLEEPAGDAPYVVVLGTAQDGGFPQIGSDHARARAAREDPARRRLVASLLVADPRTGSRWLIDATPDIREQVDRSRGHPVTRSLPGSRPPLFEGIFLTHAHMGHYTGLVHLGREAYNARRLPVHAAEDMTRFLASNGPWDLLVRLENIVLHPLVPETPVVLGEDLTVTPLSVPHRSEYTGTVGFIVRGPRRSLLYIPDIDKWEVWDRRIERVLETVDVALLDGTFYADGEIPGRSMADIPHPFIAESLLRFRSLPASERAKVIFTHLNHTNPAADEGGPAWSAIQRAGCSVAREMQIIEL